MEKNKLRIIRSQETREKKRKVGCGRVCVGLKPRSSRRFCQLNQETLCEQSLDETINMHLLYVKPNLHSLHNH